VKLFLGVTFLLDPSLVIPGSPESKYVLDSLKNNIWYFSTTSFSFLAGYYSIILKNKK